jgi:hypothetical protein
VGGQFDTTSLDRLLEAGPPAFSSTDTDVRRLAAIATGIRALLVASTPGEQTRVSSDRAIWHRAGRIEGTTGFPS